MINLSYLNTNLREDKVVIKQILQLFLQQLPDFENSIKQYYSDNDFENLIEIAHRTKNSFQMIGAEEQANKLKDIERLSVENKKTEKLLKLIESILEDTKLIKSAIEEIID